MNIDNTTTPTTTSTKTVDHRDVISNDSPETSNGQDYSVQFMLREYEFLQTQHDTVRSEGIDRLNFLITLTSAVVGSVIIIGSNSTVPLVPLKLALLCTLLLLSSVGFDVYQHMILRGQTLDRLQRGMNRIRRYFINRDYTLSAYLILPYTDEPTKHLTFRGSVGVRRTAQTFLSFIIGFAIGTLVNLINISLVISFVLGVAGFISSYILIDIYTQVRLQRMIETVKKEVLFPKNSTTTIHKARKRSTNHVSSTITTITDNNTLLSRLLYGTESASVNNKEN